MMCALSGSMASWISATKLEEETSDGSGEKPASKKPNWRFTSSERML
ncbi:hypothetical protein [Niallia sp. NCCP-28]|nr:hypothetical protein [Niallia sp. NCCP-28]